MSKSDSHFQNAYFPISSSPLPRVTDAQILVFVERPILERHYGRMEFDASRIRRDHFALLPPMIEAASDSCMCGSMDYKTTSYNAARPSSHFREKKWVHSWKMPSLASGPHHNDATSLPLSPGPRSVRPSPLFCSPFHSRDDGTTEHTSI